MAKWEPYKKGIITRKMKGAIKKIDDKDWRKKKGIETSPLSDFKKNTHWMMYAIIQLTEALAKQFDDIVKETYLALDRQYNVVMRSTKGLESKINNVGSSLKRQNSEKAKEIAKKMKQSSMRQNKLLGEIREIPPKLDNNLDTINDNILKASKGIIKAMAREITNLRGNVEVETDEVRDKIGKLEENLLDFLNTMDNDLAVNIKNKMGEIAKAIQVLNGESKKREETLSRENDDRFNLVDEKLDDVIQKFHVASRTLRDEVDKRLTDLNKKVAKDLGDFSQNNRSALSKNGELIRGESKKSLDNINQLLETVKDNNEETRGILKEQHSELMDKVVSNHKDTTKMLEREIKEVRTLVANIRGDIELIKSFLTKMQ